MAIAQGGRRAASPHAAGRGTRAGSAGRSLASFASANSISIAVAAAYVVFWAAAARWLVAADTWMTFSDGREVVEQGLPHHVTATVLGQGGTWIDQQWLAQVVLWSIYRLGGIQLTLLVTIALLLGPVVFVMTFAQRRGASVATVCPFVLLPLLNLSSLVRAQVFSPILFVALLALLASESRKPSRRVLVVLPLLVVWANLHGAALVGASLVSLLGLTELPGALRRRTSLARASALVVLPPFALLATPYGFRTLDYYRATVGNSSLHAFEHEWHAPTFMSVDGFALFILAAATLVLVGRRRRDLTSFEAASLAVTLAGALVANRSIPWFAYATLMFIPPLAERAWRRSRTDRAPALAGLAVAVAATSVALLALGSVALRSTRSLEADWPRAAVTAVDGLLARDPQARVFASAEYGDWLLFASPAARGRVSFNGHFELLEQAQLRALAHYFGESGPRWEAIASGYSVLVLNPRTEQHLIDDLRRDPGVRVVYSDRSVIVLDRSTRSVSRNATPAS